MKIVVDNQIVKILAHNPAIFANNSFISDPNNILVFEWPSLLEYLGLGSIFLELATFDESNSFFNACISTLKTNEEKEVVFYIYDRLFAETLTQIKVLPQINASYLLEAIRKRKELESHAQIFSALNSIELALVEKPSHTIHDLILYLAWDRMCVCIGRLFNYQSTDLKFIENLNVLKECLVESYQHITRQGHTRPGIYRLLESLFLYQMREENLSKHTETEWKILSQSFPALKGETELVDFFYIDDAVILQEKQGNNMYFMTLDSSEMVNTRLAFASNMLDVLKREIPDWSYVLHPQEIIYFR